MPTFNTKRRVRHAAGEMFDLVADVEHYPEFLPLCRALTILSREKIADGREIIVADMTVAYKLIRETFRSKVTLDRPKLRILVEYLDGPFKYLENRWSFDPVDGAACNVEFFISYEFKSRVLGLLMGAMFNSAFRRFTTAFERRADEIYSTKTA